jgi:hypothetical protein
MEKNYYGDAIQTCEAFNMYPTSKKLEVTLRFRVYNNDTNQYDWYNAPQGLKVNVKYSNSNILDVFTTTTTNNQGKITINNVAELQNLIFDLDQVIGSDQYYLYKTITSSDLENYEYTVRVEISKSTAPASGEIDIDNDIWF